MMANYHIRVYKDEDYEMVRDLFKSGMEEHVRPLFEYIMKLPRTKVLLLGAFLGLYISFKSLLLSATTISAILAFIWFASNYIFTSYIQAILQEDLLDIQRYYLDKKGFGFWVAEAHGKVIGTVAALPYFNAAGGSKVELKRMYVKKEYRGQGLGKAFCRKLIYFARQEGYSTIVLETSIVHYDAQRLYENMGFKLDHMFVAPSFIERLLHFLILHYRLDIPVTNGQFLQKYC
ncbi:hypothetical protein NDU88_007011 [Pleurodeles waltl]|uniref:N-acetyltransferase domain-containing protein n=1 Tax=Pleurodeles waltl TaxID=8319 RepID=A0AAV7WC86_PLEWA|nr:hypothetical protein NDU88_007011 [Pleurodeles waltl]